MFYTFDSITGFQARKFQFVTLYHGTTLMVAEIIEEISKVVGEVKRRMMNWRGRMSKSGMKAQNELILFIKKKQEN